MKIKNTKAQMTMPEYTVLFFIVIGAVVSMTVFIQRTFQARIRDAKVVMVDQARVACDADCQKAGGFKEGENIAMEYEPYYGQVESRVKRENRDATGLLEGGNAGVFRKVSKTKTEMETTSIQAPPGAAENDVSVGTR